MLKGSTLALPLGSTDGDDLGLDGVILRGSDLGEVHGSTLAATDVTKIGFFL